MELRFPHSISGKVKRFPGKGGWYYIMVPKKYTTLSKQYKHGRFVRILAQIGASRWGTSLLPFGKGVDFIAIKASIRKEQGIKEGSKINLQFRFIGEA